METSTSTSVKARLLTPSQIEAHGFGITSVVVIIGCEIGAGHQLFREQAALHATEWYRMTCWPHRQS